MTAPDLPPPSAPPTPGRNYDYDFNGYAIDHQPFIRDAGAADLTYREDCLAALRAYYVRVARVARLRNLIDTRAEYAELAKEGFTLSNEEREAAYEQFSDETVKAAADAKLHRAILDRLAQDTEAGARRLGQAVIDEFQRDLETLGRFDGPLIQKYAAPVVPSPLAAALQRAIAKLRDMIAQPHSLAWHYDPRQALSYSFPEAAPLVVDGAPATPPPPAAQPAPAAGGLPTAAELAMQPPPLSPLATRRPLAGGWKTIE